MAEAKSCGFGGGYGILFLFFFLLLFNDGGFSGGCATGETTATGFGGFGGFGENSLFFFLIIFLLLFSGGFGTY